MWYNCGFGTLMKSKLNRRLRRKENLVRVVAIFFLLFTLADITFPEVFCREGIGAFVTEQPTFASATTRTETATVASMRRSDDPQPDMPTNQAPHEEDCFCCCGHVMTVTVFVNCQALIMKSPPFTLYQDRLPTTPPQSPFRPPRHA